MDVLVIGAGPAGIACAYALEKAGLRYKILDRASEIGSTWNSLYPSLRLNTSRFFSHLPEKKFPLHYGIFPTGKQYHHYLEAYVQERDYNIHLGVSVHSIEPEGAGWRVETDQGTEWYPAVIAATGRFNSPICPQIPGMAHFRGQIIHASTYLGPEPFVNKRVMVVGNGPSGLDIVTELADYVKIPALLSQRTGVYLKPRYPWGLPKHLWMIIAEKLPEFIGKPLLEAVSKQGYPKSLLKGIKTPQTGEMSSAAGGTRGRGFIDAVRAGKIKSVDGPVEFCPDAIILQDGSQVAVDIVIMATGYRPVIFQYFKKPVAINAHGWPVRVNEPPNVYWQGDRQVKGYPGLYLVGVYYQGKGAMYNFNVEAEAATHEIIQHLKQIKRPNPTENAYSPGL